MKEKKARTKGVGGLPVSRRAFILLGVAGVGLAWAIDEAWTALTPNSTIEELQNPLFIDAETGRTFHIKMGPGMTIPAISPFTGRATGYPAVFCYWTKDGGQKTDPTAVLMHSYIGKPEPTFCPDCDRLVVRGNPRPKPGMTPPPTEAEYWATHSRPPNWSE